MKNLNHLIILFCLVSLSACVATKKYNALDQNYKTMQKDDNNCNQKLHDAQGVNDQQSEELKKLQAESDDLKKQLDNAKQGNGQLLDALQNVSVLSNKQAESIKQSIADISQKDSYIKGLQSALARKDSMNMDLVNNLKGALHDVNDQDITIKVEKGVVYVDISDRMLFNSGQYKVTEEARKVLAKVAMVLNARPDFDFMVMGNTDTVPIHTGCLDDNWDLSVKRATSVIRLLEHEYHITPSRMCAAGYGKYAPVASNRDAAGRALNRHTSIIILPQLDQFFKLLTKK